MTSTSLSLCLVKAAQTSRSEDRSNKVGWKCSSVVDSCLPCGRPGFSPQQGLRGGVMEEAKK